MHQTVLLYLACILAGFALANVPTSSVITAGIATFFQIIGGIAVIVFSLAILYLGVKTLLDK
ncbi:hypothetical protein SAMN05216232_3152 [Virgibacillus subterraneus]|uniref:Uncharacterized protein n=3 Tax=Virgibacillus TaxID=84406 RepID=A0A1H1FN46_9BACI|nr:MULTISPECIES: hypothetical protein [Virgibacillus]MBP1948619.1 amino acid transporter [Virgibacillus litoralis]SDR02320.1 hypothetical protein SAMN05216231_3309 [Virgibacillus salinus]SEQ72489.1 hypothetical protein SAMN05216232_3152 [Virgibacillus subterraneus]